MGSRNRAMPPTRKITIERTAAKMGRLMKKSEKFMTSGARARGWRARQWPGAAVWHAAKYERRGGRSVLALAAGEFGRERRRGFRGGEFRSDGHTGAHALQAVDDDLVAGFQTGAHD